MATCPCSEWCRSWGGTGCPAAGECLGAGREPDGGIKRWEQVTLPIPAPAGAASCWEPAQPGEPEVPVGGGSTQGPAPGASPSTKTGWGSVQVEGCRQGWPCLVTGSPRLQGGYAAHLGELKRDFLFCKKRVGLEL